MIREMQLMSSVLNVARREWGLINHNMISDVQKPKKPPPRDRLPTSDEIDRMISVAGEDLTKATARAFHAFRFAMVTAMRAGEIAGLTWDRVDIDRRVARLTHTKNGRPREVPLSSEAVRLLGLLPELDPVFGLSSAQLDVLFRKVRDKAGVEPHAGAAYWAGISLGNLSGKMLKEKGRRWSAQPDRTDEQAFVPPAWCRRLIFIMDGDSEPWMTRAKLECGLRRAMILRPGLEGWIVPAGEGRDLNDILTRRGEPAPTDRGVSRE